MQDRHERVATLLQERAAQFIRVEANTDPLITVTRASVSPDYKRATIFVTTIPDTPEKEQHALIFLKRYSGEFRSQVKKSLAMKIIPHIEFEIDYGERHRQNIDEIARNIKKDET